MLNRKLPTYCTLCLKSMYSFCVEKVATFENVAEE